MIDKKILKFFIDYKWTFLIISFLLILGGGYYGKDAFSNLQDGGFVPPNADSVRGMNYISDYLTYPNYAISIMVQGNPSLNASTAEFQDYYNTIMNNLIAEAPVTDVIGYYDYPYQTRMISGDETKVLLYASIQGSITPGRLSDIVSITPLKTYVGGTYPFGEELSSEILAGVQVAEFGTLPVIIVCLTIALGGNPSN